MALLLEITKSDGSFTRTPLQSQATKVGAWPGGKVKIVDSATGKAPAGISAKKVGDSLVIDNLPEGKTVEITKFYTDCSPATPCSLVIDPADGGQAAAITQTSAPVAALADNQALMYGPASGGAAAVAGVPTSVIVGGLALVGLAAAGGGGGSSSSTPAPAPTPDTTKPAAPSLSLTGASDSGTTGDLLTNDNTPTVRVALTGSGATAPAAGDTVTVYSGSAAVGTVVLSAANITAGYVDVTTTTLGADGTKTLTATVTDLAGNVSTASGTLTLTIDTTAPGAPTAVVGLNGSVSGVAEAGSTVTIGAASTTADATTGTYTFAAGTLASGATASVTATDATGNTSAGTGAAAGTYELGTAGADIIVAGTKAFIDGGAGNDMLVGGSGGSVRNYQFDYWNAPDVGSILYNNDSGRLVTFGESAQNGWTIGATPSSILAGPVPVEQFTSGRAVVDGEPGINVLDNSRGAGTDDDTGGGGRFAWDSVRNADSGGTTISQQVITHAGTQYALAMQVSDNDYGTSLGVYWGGALLAFYDSESNTWSGTAPIIVDNAGSRSTWAWTVDAAADTTLLEIRAYSAAGDDGQGMMVDRVTLNAITADGAETLAGGAGSDLLFGQEGDDTLYGGALGNTAATANGVADTFAYSLRADNGSDVIKDFQVGVDRIYLIDALDTFNTAAWQAPPADANPGTTDPAPTTANADANLSFEDFIQASSASQYLMVENDGAGSVKLSFWGESNTGTATALGSVVLEGVAFGSGAGQYDTVEDLFTGGVVVATMDGLHAGLMNVV